MQFMAATGIYGFPQSTGYLQFTACFSWVNFDVTLHLGAQDTRPASYPHIRETFAEAPVHARAERDIDQYAESLELAPWEVILYKLFFFSVFFVPPLLLGIIFCCVGVALRPDEFSDFQGSALFACLFVFCFQKLNIL